MHCNGVHVHHDLLGVQFSICYACVYTFAVGMPFLPERAAVDGGEES